MGDAPARRIPLWVEPYAGSLAVGLRLLGARHLVGWMGGKSRYADAIMSILNVSAADEIWCADISPWASCWRALSRPGVGRAAAGIIEEIEADALSRGDCPASYRAVWLELREEHRQRPRAEDARAVAVWLALVKGSGMTCGPAGGPKWRSDAAWRRNKADDCINADRFDAGVLHPRWGYRSPALRLRVLPDPLPVRVWDDGAAIPPRRGAVALLDPPYVGTRGYNGVASTSVDMAAHAAGVRDAWLAAGSTVATCEGTSSAGGVPYDLADRGRNVANGARMHAGKASKQGEWLTVYRRPIEVQPMLWDRPLDLRDE